MKIKSKTFQNINKINTETSNLFSIGIILLRINLLLNEDKIKGINKYN